MAAEVGVNGADLLLYVEDSGTPGTFLYLNGQRDLSLANTRAEIDISSKDQAEEKTLPGRKTQEASFEAVYVKSDTPATDPEVQAFNDLKAAYDDGTKVNVQIWEVPVGGGAAVKRDQGLSTVLEWSQSAPDQEASVVSARLKVDAWIAAP